MVNAYQFFAGIDWATEKNDVAFINATLSVHTDRVFAHTADGIHELCEFLKVQCHGALESLAVGIEVPHGAVVESLIERGFHVFSINPKQLDRFRDRHCPSGAKDDSLDSFVIADSLRTDMHCFRRIKLNAPDIIMLRELSRLDDDLSESRNRLTNRLRQQIFCFAPHLLSLSPSLDEEWFFELLDEVGDFSLVASMTESKIAKLLRRHKIRRLSAKDVLPTLRQNILKVAEGTIPAARRHMKTVIRKIRLVQTEQRDVRKDIQQVMERLSLPIEEAKHRDAAIIDSLPGAGIIVVAMMLSEAAQAIAERDYDAIRAHSGVAPVTKRSGKRKQVLMRQACNGRLRNAIYHWSRVSVQRDDLCKAKYAALRARGHSHGRALRTVADGLLRMMCGMLKTGSLFDATRRVAAVS